MLNWRKYRNFRKVKHPDGYYTYTITVDGTEVKVSKEIYKAYATLSRKMEYMEYDLKRDRVLQDVNGNIVTDEYGLPSILPELEVSLEKLIDEDWDFPDSETLMEDVVIRNMEFTELHHRLESLIDNERDLIQALYFDGMTEREYSSLCGIAQKTINDRKHRILHKLRKVLKS